MPPLQFLKSLPKVDGGNSLTYESRFFKADPRNHLCNGNSIIGFWMPRTIWARSSNTSDPRRAARLFRFCAHTAAILDHALQLRARTHIQRP